MAFHGRSAGHGEPDPYLQGAPWGVSQEHHRSQDGLREAREEKQKPSVECKVLLTINEFGEFPLCHNANRKLLLLLPYGQIMFVGWPFVEAADMWRFQTLPQC